MLRQPLEILFLRKSSPDWKINFANTFMCLCQNHYQHNVRQHNEEFPQVKSKDRIKLIVQDNVATQKK